MSSDFTRAIYTADSVVIGLGVAGNIMSFIIFSRKPFKNNSISTYFRATSVIQSLTIYQFIINMGILFANIDITSQSDLPCKLLFYSWPVYDSSTSWILMVFSIDKMLNMSRKPIPIIKKKWFQWTVVTMIVLIHAILYIGVPFDLKRFEIFPGFYYCFVSNLSFFRAFSFIYLIETSFIPFVVMMVTSIVTIRLLIKSRKSLGQVGKLERLRRARDTKFAISSLTFNFFFITFKMPFLVGYILMSFYSQLDFSYFGISLFLFFVNMSSNFYINLATNSVFRREFLTICRLNKSDRDNLNTSSNSNTANRIFPILRKLPSNNVITSLNQI